MSRVTRYPLSHWADDIKKAWGRGAANTLALAKIVSQARRSLAFGEWSDLWRLGKMPFSKRKADMLKAIGEGVENLDEQISAHLPMAWNVLYYLSLLGWREIDRLVREGRIHPGLKLREAKALLAGYHPAAVQKVPRPNVQQRLVRFAAFVETTFAEWSGQQRTLAQRQLSALLERIGQPKPINPRNPKTLQT